MYSIDETNTVIPEWFQPIVVSTNPLAREADEIMREVSGTSTASPTLTCRRSPSFDHIIALCGSFLKCGYPKSFILVGFSTIHLPVLEYSFFGNRHVEYCSAYMSIYVVDLPKNKEKSIPRNIPSVKLA